LWSIGLSLYDIQDHSYPEFTDFCQYGVADIDEFPITKRGELLFDALANVLVSALTISGLP
jgi:hypothetical protein